MGKLDDLAALRQNGPKTRRTAPRGSLARRQSGPKYDATRAKAAARKNGGELPEVTRVTELEAEIGAAFAALPIPAIPNTTLAEAITAYVETTKNPDGGIAKRRGKGVASTSEPTECLQCAKRRKAKARSMQRYRAKIAKKVKRARK